MRARAVWAGLIACATALAGCTGSHTPLPTPHVSQSPTARIVAHRSPVLTGKFDAPVVAFGSASSGLVELGGYVGTSSTLYTWFDRTGDGGATWSAGHVTRRPHAASTQIGVTFTGEQFGWAYQPSLDRTDDAGRSWRSEPTAPTMVTGLSTAGSATWLLGAPCPDCRASLYRSKGPTAPVLRVAQQPPVAGRLVAVARLTIQRGVVLATAPQHRFVIARTRTTGRSWHVGPAPCAASTQPTLSDAGGALWLACVQPSTSMCGCDGRVTVYRSLDGAATWRRMTPRGTQPATAVSGISTLRPASASVAWAVTSRGNASSLLRTVDGGRTWHVVLSSRHAAGTDMRSLAVLDGQTAWLVASGARDGGRIFWVYRTTDGGQSWHHAVLPAPPGLPK